MDNTLIISGFFIGIGMGIYINSVIIPLLMKDERFIEKQRDRAIEKHFSCNRNEFTYFLEDNNDYFILTLKGEEHRIKFSKNRPFKIIYDEVVVFT